MLIRYTIAALLMAGTPALAADLNDTHVAVGTPGGRSPGMLYRPHARPTLCQQRAVPHVPAGKLSWGPAAERREAMCGAEARAKAVRPAG